MTALSVERSDAAPKGGRPVLTALIVLTGVFLSSLDLFIVNIAFPSISKSFHGESTSSLSWVLSAYAIVFAAALVPAGRWADRTGRKRAFLLGLAIFTAVVGRVRPGPLARRPDRCPRRPGRGRRPHAADLARAAPPRLRPRPQGRGDRAVVGRRRGGRRLRPPDRRPARPGELALGLPGQPALQRARPRVRGTPPLRGEGPRGAQVRPARRRAAVRVGGRPPSPPSSRARPGAGAARASSVSSSWPRRPAPGWPCARSTTRTRSSSRRSSATVRWRWPTSAPRSSSPASGPSSSAASCS